MNEIFTDFLNLLIHPVVRWVVFLLNIITIGFAYQQEITRYSTTKGFTGLQYNWHFFIILLTGVFGSFLAFLGLWYTIPFTDILPQYWFIPIFIILIAYYTQITIDTKTIKPTDEFTPPPSNILPKKYRVLITYITLILDLLMFLQFYIYFGVFDYSKNTILHRFLLERFGGWYDGNKLAYLTEWLGLLYVSQDIYSIWIQKTFSACEYKLPLSWNF